MKIDHVSFRPVELPRHEPFKIATGTTTAAMNVMVRARVDGTEGWGCSASNSVTGESTETILDALGSLAPGLKGLTFTDIETVADAMDRILPGSPAAKAGIDIALHDAVGRIEGRPTCDILGRVRVGQLTDITLGIEDTGKTLDEARRWLDRGFRAIKIKVGLDPDEDIRRVEAVRDLAGTGIRIWVDANQGYSVEEALRFAGAMADLGVEFVEQPVDRNDLDALARVRERSPVPIMVDESVLGPEDAKRVIELDCADMVNIKLMKCGGICRARQIARICKDAGKPNMIGCMSESTVSIAGALHFALSQENVRYADLDAHLFLARDVATGPELRDGMLFPGRGPGLGLMVDQSAL